MGERTRSPRSLALMFLEHRPVHQTIHPHTPPQRRAGRSLKAIRMLYKNNKWQHRLPCCPWATAFAALQCGSISGLAVFPEWKGNGISILAGMQMFGRVTCKAIETVGLRKPGFPWEAHTGEEEG